jgi:hypothetical protein
MKIKLIHQDPQEVDSIVLDINGKTYSIRESIEGNLVITDIACNGSILVHPRTDNSIEIR